MPPKPSIKAKASEGPVALKLRACADIKPMAWLLKSEPESYGLKDWERDGKTWWEGVRNYQARNFMTQHMQIGDFVLFYHSNANPSAIVGLGRVSAAATVDQSAFNRKSPYYDAKSKPEKPSWYCVQVSFEKALSRPLALNAIKEHTLLKKMLLAQPGQRLSITPVTPQEFKTILNLTQA